MSLAVGETHGNDAPEELPARKGLNVVGRRVGREGVRPLRGRQAFCDRDPWVSPTANDIVPLRGTRQQGYGLPYPLDFYRTTEPIG